MREPTNQPPGDIAEIVADALIAAANGLSRWLEQPIDAVKIIASPADESVAESFGTEFGDETYRCSMKVDVVFPPNRQSDDAPPAAVQSAGHLLLAWHSDDAAWLINQSLQQRSGTAGEFAQWDSLHDSTLAETCNIVGCEFLNLVTNRIRAISQTDVALTPSPPRVSHPFSGETIDRAIGDLDDQRNGKPWITFCRLQAPNTEAVTRIGMIWSADVWNRLSRLVNGHHASAPSGQSASDTSITGEGAS